MAEERTTTANSVWEVLDTIFYRVSIFISIGFPVAFGLIWWVNPRDHSLWALYCDFFEALITNVVAVAWGYVLSRFFLLRHLQSIRSKQESDVLATIIANKTQMTVVSELQSMQRKIDEVLEHVDLGRTAHALGVGGTTCDWTEFAHLSGTLGAHLKKRLLDTKNATWYIVTMSPHGLQTWLPEIEKAVENRGVDVKWAYYAPKNTKDCDALMVQLKWLSRPDKRLERLQTNIDSLHDTAERSSNKIHAMDGEHRKRAGRWELYESKMPHFYLAFLSVPRKNEETPEQVPDGTFGFVCLYTMFPDQHKHETRPTLYLEASGQIQPTILNCYYWSIIQLFDEGVKRRYLRRTWPLEPKPDPEREKEQEHGAELSN